MVAARQEVVERDDADKRVSSDGLLPKPCRFTSTRLIDTNDEYRVPEAEFTEKLKPLESIIREANKPPGLWSHVKGFIKRVMVGPELPEFDPKHYGFHLL